MPCFILLSEIWVFSVCGLVSLARRASTLKFSVLFSSLQSHRFLLLLFPFSRLPWIYFALLFSFLGVQTQIISLRTFLILNVSILCYRFPCLHSLHCILQTGMSPFYFSPSSSHFCIFFETSFLWHGLPTNVLITSQVFGHVTFVFTLLISQMNQLWSKNMLYVISILSNVLRFVLWPVLVNAHSCVKRMCIPPY